MAPPPMGLAVSCPVGAPIWPTYSSCCCCWQPSATDAPLGARLPLVPRGQLTSCATHAMPAVSAPATAYPSWLRLPPATTSSSHAPSSGVVLAGSEPSHLTRAWRLCDDRGRGGPRPVDVSSVTRLSAAEAF